MTPGPIRVGCAGWSLPREEQHRFGAGDSHLQRYATRLNATEINSSFHRPHADWVWRRWADAVGEEFRFSVKLPKAITHEQRLAGCAEPLAAFLSQARLLGAKLGCLLVQLPPSLAFDEATARAFFSQLRSQHAGDIAFEPRHASWFEPHADALLAEHRIARVLADPVRHAPGRVPGGWTQCVYLRLHGSPRMYYSAYEPAVLQALALRMQQEAAAGHKVWCIFDNTASAAAAGNALDLLQYLHAKEPLP